MGHGSDTKRTSGLLRPPRSCDPSRSPRPSLRPPSSGRRFADPPLLLGVGAGVGAVVERDPHLIAGAASPVVAERNDLAAVPAGAIGSLRAGPAHVLDAGADQGAVAAWTAGAKAGVAGGGAYPSIGDDFRRAP